MAATPTPTPTPAYVVGDTGPSGGIIYYVDNAGFSCGANYSETGSPTGGKCKYLEVAPSGWNGGADPTKLWAVTANQASDVSGIANDSDAFNAYNNALGIGLGYKNSDLIVNQGGPGVNDATTAAGAARAYTATVLSVTYSDWYLPTTAELNLLCQWNRGLTQVVTTRCTGGSLNTGTSASGSGFVGGYYWSSSGYLANGAWGQSFGNGVQNGNNKYGTYYVRPVRAF